MIMIPRHGEAENLNYGVWGKGVLGFGGGGAWETLHACNCGR